MTKYFSILFVLLVGCQTTPEPTSPFDHCVIKTEEWALVNLDQSVQSKLLASRYDKSSVLSSFSVSSDQKISIWFENSSGDLSFCIYEDLADSCLSKSQSVIFKKKGNEYEVQRIHDKLCMWHNLRT